MGLVDLTNDFVRTARALNEALLERDRADAVADKLQEAFTLELPNLSSDVHEKAQRWAQAAAACRNADRALNEARKEHEDAADALVRFYLDR